MISNRGLRTWMVWAGSAGALLLVACSSTTNNYAGASCGPGTSLVDGVCVATSGDAGDDATEAASDTDPVTDGSVDVACPSLDVNCSMTCGGPTANCADVTCNEEYPDFDLRGAKDRVVVRTPEKPDWALRCETACGPGKLAYQIAFDTLVESGVTVRGRVPPPWKMYPIACGLSPIGECTVDRNLAPVAQKLAWVIATTDPHAPSVDAIIERVPDGTACE